MPIMAAPNTLTATEIARQIDCRHADGRGRHPRPSRRIDKRDADVLAWSHLAREAALERARRSIAGRARACCTACRSA
jgi:hypothetical protein